MDIKKEQNLEEINVSNILNKKKSVEEFNKKKIEIMKWNYSDVLYSFLGIYVLGINAIHKEQVECCKTLLRPKNRVVEKQKLYSHAYIKENYNKFDKLNNLPELQNFIEVYFEIGNVIPIWPGGNSHRGQSQCYDLAYIYFNKKHIKDFSNNYFKEYLNPDNSFMDSILINEYSKFEITHFLEFKEDEYKDFLVHIVKNINERTTQLEKWILDNSNMEI